jgi:hypothetical protein
VTVDPRCVTVAFQPLVTVTPDRAVQVDLQVRTVDEPVLVIVASAVKPPCHELVTLCEVRQALGHLSPAASWEGHRRRS